MKRIIPWVLAAAAVLYFSFPVNDADLGWHLRYGEYFLSTGKVMRHNEFSWLLPDFKWVNHSWGFDVIAAALFGASASRFWLLSISAGILVSLALWITLPAATLTAGLSWLVFSFFGGELLNNGIRSQTFSLVLTALVWMMLRKHHKQTTTRWIYVLIPLFWLWSNLHGQFVYGLGLVGLYSLVLLRSAKNYTQYRSLLLTLAGSSLITLLNPWGHQLWLTAAGHLNNPALKYIYEWLPWELKTPRMAALLIFSSVFWWHIWKKRVDCPPQLCWPLITTAALALFSRRIIPYYLLMALPYTAKVFDLYLKKLKLPRESMVYLTTASAALAFYMFNQRDIFTQTWDTYCNSHIYCSEAAVKFMRDNKIYGKLFNAYRLGGYLNYRLPEVKTMVDGRMTLWQDANGYSPFLDYTTMIYLQSGSREKFAGYDPDYVIIQPQYPLASVLVKTENWPIIYQDSKVLLFKNPRIRDNNR